MIVFKKVILWITISLCCQLLCIAQQYKGGIGARFGYGTGISGIYMIQNGHGLEFLLRYGYHGLILNKPGVNFQTMYQKHWELGQTGAWTVFLGAGPSFGFGQKNVQSKQKYFALGFSPQFGFDYTSQRLRIPIILTLDYKPAINGDFPIKNNNEKVGKDFSFYEIAFSVRFALSRRR